MLYFSFGNFFSLSNELLSGFYVVTVGVQRAFFFSCLSVSLKFKAGKSQRDFSVPTSEPLLVNASNTTAYLHYEDSTLKTFFFCYKRTDQAEDRFSLVTLMT